MLDELVRLVSHELDAIHDPYAWPPGPDLCDRPEAEQREHRRLRAVMSALIYRGNVAEHAEQEEAREHGALYPSRDEWLDVRYGARHG